MPKVKWWKKFGVIIVRSTQEDLAARNRVIELLKERFSKWQEKGYIPSQKLNAVVIKLKNL